MRRQCGTIDSRHSEDVVGTVWMDIDTEAREEHWRLLYRESKTEIVVDVSQVRVMYKEATRNDRIEFKVLHETDWLWRTEQFIVGRRDYEQDEDEDEVEIWGRGEGGEKEERGVKGLSVGDGGRVGTG